MQIEINLPSLREWILMVVEEKPRSEAERELEKSSTSFDSFKNDRRIQPRSNSSCILLETR